MVINNKLKKNKLFFRKIVRLKVRSKSKTSTAKKMPYFFVRSLVPQNRTGTAKSTV